MQLKTLNELKKKVEEKKKSCPDQIQTTTPELHFSVDCDYLRWCDEWVCLKGEYPYKACFLAQGKEAPI